MAATSTMLELGTEAPDFTLPDVTTGRIVRRSDFDDRKALLVMFICRHCPYVGHVRPALAQLGRDYGDQGVAIVAISANDPAAYPEDAPESLAEEAFATRIAELCAIGSSFVGGAFSATPGI